LIWKEPLAGGSTDGWKSTATATTTRLVVGSEGEIQRAGRMRYHAIVYHCYGQR
jgi:hypothetical protein